MLIFYLFSQVLETNKYQSFFKLANFIYYFWAIYAFNQEFNRLSLSLDQGCIGYFKL